MNETNDHSVCPPSLPSIPQATLAPRSSKGRWFATSAIAIAVVGVIPVLIYLINALTCTMPSYGMSTFFLLMCAFGLLVHFLGLVLAIIATVMGSKAGGIVGIICNVGLLLLIVGGALVAAS